MIGTQARASFERMVEAGLQNALRDASGEPVEVEACGPLQPEHASRMVLMLIASHEFRMVLALSFPRNRDTHAYLVRVGRMVENDDSEQAFRDAISETGNLCCGTVNREIGRFYRHTGMSTPQIIDSRSAPHVDTLSHHQLSHFRIGVGGGCCFHASLCIYAHEPMDFEWLPETEPETSGELEFF